MTSEPNRTGAGASLLGGAPGDNPALAASFMLGSLALLSFQDGLVKFLSSEISFWQLQTVRAALNFTFVILLARLVWRRDAPAPKSFFAVALRSLLIACATVCFFAGAPFISLSEMAAGLYMFPLFVALFSALWLGERVGPRRIGAILVGFSGAMLILQPGGDAFRPMALAPIGAGLCYAGAVLTTRRLCREESPLTLVYGVAIALFIFGVSGLLLAPRLSPPEWTESSPFLFSGVSDMAPWVLGIIIVTSLLNVTANIGLARAYQAAESSWLAPFDYSYFVFSALWGVVLFDAVPTPITALGLTMIAGAGAFVAWRERQESRRRV